MTGRQNTKQDVLRAAGRLFAERGFHGTSMRDLGGELGLLGSSLYSHVGGKSEMLVEVIRSGAVLFQDLARSVDELEASAADRLEMLMAGHVEILTEHIDEATTFLNEARFLPEDERSAIVAMRDQYEATYRNVISEGVAAGEFKHDLDPALTTILVLSMLNAMHRWYRADGPQTPAEIAAQATDLVMEGLR